MSDPVQSEFSIGRVLRHSFAILNLNIASFGLLAVILMIPNSYFVISPLSGEPMEIFGLTNPLAVTGISMIINIIFSSLLAAMLIHGTFESIRGRQVTTGNLLARGLDILWSVVGLSIVLSIIIAAGLFFLIVPGIILMVMLYVAIPVKVVEGAPLAACLTRSVELTAGRRWELFGLLVLVGVIAILSQAFVGLLATALGSVLIAGIVAFLVTAYVGAFSAVLSALVYFELRAEKEHVTIDTLAGDY